MPSPPPNAAVTCGRRKRKRGDEVEEETEGGFWVDYDSIIGGSPIFIDKEGGRACLVREK